MAGIANFLQSLVDFADGVVALIVNLVNGLLQLFKMIPSALRISAYSIAQIPPVVSVFLTAMVLVSVTYLIIGR